MTEQLIAEVVRRFEESGDRIDKCLSLISQDALWRKPGPELVSVGNLVNHLCGNISQWILAGVGRQSYARRRNDEFEQITNESSTELAAKMRSVIDQAVTAVRGLSEADLARVYRVQGQEETGVGILVHVTEHLSYHVGQITFYVKLVENTDVGYYEGVALDEP